eukprot:TRINITY_DN646_c0_g2_i1.p1 TRINITY_DN646_c0_g2~~TRINITY_DN646_c0_g2_i1.p1  ORF type:complete len:310 (-),score=52.13 TRINITY_DN646_c0_g2_i1:305-1234(-)
MSLRLSTAIHPPSKQALPGHHDAMWEVAKGVDFDRDTEVPTDSDGSSQSDIGFSSGRANTSSTLRSVSSLSAEQLVDSPRTPASRRSSSHALLYLHVDEEGRVQVVDSRPKQLALTPSKRSVLSQIASPSIGMPPGLSLDTPHTPPPGLSLLLETGSISADASASEYSDAGCPTSSFVWTVDARKLVSDHKVIVSPSFEVELAAQTVPFKVILTPKEVTLRKGGQSFKRSRGMGSIQLKCESAGDFAEMAQVKFSVGRSLSRGPVLHDFGQSGVCSLKSEIDTWNFTQAVDEASQSFDIRIEILCNKGA